LGKLVIVLTGRTRPTQARLAFNRLPLVSAAFMVFNHGPNDGQKFMGVFALTMLAGGATTVFVIPFWIMLVCAHHGRRHQLRGLGSASVRAYDVRWGVLRRIMLAWCATFPFCALLAFLTASVANGWLS